MAKSERGPQKSGDPSMPNFEVPTTTPDIHIVGLVKVGTNRYCVVTGTVANPIIDKTTEPLEYASLSLQAAALKLTQAVP